VFFRQFSSSSHRFRIINAFQVVKKDRKRRLAVGGATQQLDHSTGRPRFAFCFLWTIIVQLEPFKVFSLDSFRENRPEAEIGTERYYVAEVASQFNRPSPISYLCSVDIAWPAIAVSSYKRNTTGRGNRRQMATPSGGDLTVRWVELDLL
jgi:hypothetical protein